jgi:short-subunit dehydrogenase
MSRIHAARIVVPAMLQQGGGYLVHTASAAGVLTEIGSAPYSVTKHADVALAEWLSVRYGREGLRVSCVCPLGVQTDMIDDSDPIHRYLHLHAISCEDVAESVITGMQDERFLILPHPEVAEFFSLKTDDHDRWIRGMQRLRQKLTRDISRAKDAA